MAASTTLPPRRSISSPAAVARGLAATIMKCGARTSLRAWLPVAASVLIVVGMEGLAGWMIRDNLALNVLMLLWPVEAVREWQMQGAPPTVR